MLATLEGHTYGVVAVTVTPDGLRAVSASGDHTLKVWDLVTGKILATLEGHTSYIMTVAVTPDGQRAVSGSDDSTLKVWDLVTWRELACFHADGLITAVACASDFLFVAGSANGAMHFLELRT
jgi:WD40 repeat protein